MKEIETKFKINDLEDILDRIKALGAQKVYSQKEHDVYFRGQVVSSRCSSPIQPGTKASTIRVRHLKGDKGVFTIKKNVDNPQKNIKIKEEIEVSVENASIMESILKSLGFQERFTKEKKRDIYKYKDVSICVDELPFIGWYLEIEAEDTDKVKAAAKALGLNMDKAIKDTYMDLFNIYKIVKGKTDIEMVFEK